MASDPLPRDDVLFSVRVLAGPADSSLVTAGVAFAPGPYTVPFVEREDLVLPVDEFLARGHGNRIIISNGRLCGDGEDGDDEGGGETHGWEMNVCMSGLVNRPEDGLTEKVNFWKQRKNDSLP